MLKKICFYNHWHNGDIFVSRQFIKYIIEQKMALEHEYYYDGCDKLVKDIDIKKMPMMDCFNMNDLCLVINDVAYINTWYAAKQFLYMRDRNDTTLLTLYKLFKDALIILNHSIDNNILNFIPSINYSVFETEKILIPQNKKILVSNGDVLSGQSNNFNMDNLICELADAFPCVSFLITNHENRINKKNVFYTKNIIQKNENDLCENSFISTKCDIIIGRGSGTYTYSFVKENMFRKCYFIGITNDLKYSSFGLHEYFENKFFHVNSNISFEDIHRYINNKLGEII